MKHMADFDDNVEQIILDKSFELPLQVVNDAKKNANKKKLVTKKTFTLQKFD